MTVLEKIKVLERYVSVDPSMIDSVMEMAIDKLLKREATRMGDMHLRINDQIAWITPLISRICLPSPITSIKVKKS